MLTGFGDLKAAILPRSWLFIVPSFMKQSEN